MREGSATSRSVANELAAATWARRRAATGSVGEQVGQVAVLAVGKPPTASAMRSSRTSAASGVGERASAGAITGNRFASTLPTRRARVDESPEHVVGASRLGEAQAPEQLLGGGPVGARDRMQLRRAGERFQQRPVEQPFVDRTDEAGRSLVLRGERVRVGEAE